MAVAAGLAFGLTGCQEESKDPISDLTAAAEKAANQNSYKAKGMNKDREGESSFDLVYSEKPAAMDVKGTGPKTADNPTGEIRVVRTNGTLYFKVGQSVNGKTWAKIDGRNAKEAPRADSGDSAGLQAAVLATSKDVRRVGEESVGGRKGTHYKGAVVISELSAYKGDLLTEKQRDTYVQSFKFNKVKSLDIDVWVGKDGLPAKTRRSSKGSKGEATETMEYLEYGLQVTVQAPPAHEVASMEEMFKDMKTE